MKTKLLLVAASLGLSTATFADGITVSTQAFGTALNADGKVVVNTNISSQNVKTIKKSFYGADTQGFSALPLADLVTPLNLGYFKLGGNSLSTYNWEQNAYYDSHDNQIYYVYSPLERRLRFIQQEYKATGMFQVNMLGWQPDLASTDGKLEYKQSADAKHAADSITFLNGKNKLGLVNVIMGSEPFDAMDTHSKPIPSADEYIDQYIQYAVAVREAQEKVSGNGNDLKLWGPEISSGWTNWQTAHPKDCTEDVTAPGHLTCSYGNGQFTDFIPYFLYRLTKFEKDTVKNPKHFKMLDVLTFHYYPLFRSNFSDRDSIIQNKNGEQNVHAMLESANVWNRPNYINKFDYASPRGYAPNIAQKFQDWKNNYYPGANVAITEFGVDSAENIEYNPVVRPMYLADVVPRLGTSGLDTMVLSFLQAGQQESSLGLINGTEKTPLYYVYSLYSNYFIGSTLDSMDTFGDSVNAYTVKNGTDTNIFIVNKDTVDHVTSLTFKNNDVEKSITDVSLPSYSLTVVTVPDNRAQGITVRRYGSKEMGLTK